MPEGLTNVLNSVMNDDAIHGPDYEDLNTEIIHVIFFIIIFVLSLIGFRVALTSSSPTTKAVVAILISISIAAFVVFSIFMGWT